MLPTHFSTVEMIFIRPTPRIFLIYDMIDNNFNVKELEKISFKLLGGEIKPAGNEASDMESFGIKK